MTRRRLIIGASIAVAAVGCWWCVVRPTSEMRVGGISPWTGPSWECRHSFPYYGCQREWRDAEPGPPRRFEQFALCVTSFELLGFGSDWAYGDSASWMRGRDSVDRAMRGRPRRTGGAPALSLEHAGNRIASARLLAYMRVREWRLRPSDVTVIASRQRMGARTGNVRYAIDVRAAAPALGCWSPTPRVHVPTIREALAAIHRTIAEQVGF